MRTRDHLMVHGRPTACIRSTGCISNLLDGTAYERLLEESGYRLVNDIKKAELVLLNTCAFNQLKEEEAVQLIERTKRERRDGARIVVCGCLPGINPERLGAIHDDIAFGPRDPTALLEILNGGLILTPPDSAPISYYEYSP